MIGYEEVVNGWSKTNMRINSSMCGAWCAVCGTVGMCNINTHTHTKRPVGATHRGS